MAILPCIAGVSGLFRDFFKQALGRCRETPAVKDRRWAVENVGTTSCIMTVLNVSERKFSIALPAQTVFPTGLS